MSSFYTNYYNNYWKHRVENDKIYKKLPTRTLKAVEIIGDHKNLAVLDIGTGEGSMGKVLGKNHQIDGIEVSKTAASLAKKYYKHIWIGDVTDPALQENVSKKYDVITCMEVIEHLIDPYALLEFIYTHLKPGGRIILSTPNIAWWKYRLDLLKGVFIDEIPCYGNLDHLHFFTVNSMTQTLLDTGFTEVTSNHAYTLPWKLSKLPVFVQNKIGETRPNLFAYQMVLTATKPVKKKS